MSTLDELNEKQLRPKGERRNYSLLGKYPTQKQLKEHREKIKNRNKAISEAKKQQFVDGAIQKAEEAGVTLVVPYRGKLKYDPIKAEKICGLVTEGQSLKEISKLRGMPTYNMIVKWSNYITEFKNQLDNAYIARADYYVDQLYELMAEVKEGIVDPKRATFVADQIKWLAERLHPKFMQNKTKTDVNVQVNDDGKVQFNIMLANPGVKNDDNGTSSSS